MKFLLLALTIASCSACPRNTLRCNENNVEICDGMAWNILQNCTEDGFKCCELYYGTERIESCATQEMCDRHANK